VAARGFTILELMISIAIVFILITSALVALRSAKRGADRAMTRNALRQMMTAYIAYSGENNGQLLPGYINPSMIGPATNQFDIKVKLPSGYKVLPGDAASYVWRLAPYLDYGWKTYMADYGSTALVSRFEEEFGGGDGMGGDAFGPATASPTQLGIARHPSFGLASIFVGGDSFHGGSLVVPKHPWIKLPNPVFPPERLPTITRMAEAKYPSKIIVFAPAQATNPPLSPGADVILGYPELRPPFTRYADTTNTGQQRQWVITGSESEGTKITLDSGTATPAGIPVDRFGEGRLSIAHLDGSVELELLESLGPTTANPDHCLFTRWLPDALDLK
jgi:type II secretory pathway pseudopilin PulG